MSGVGFGFVSVIVIFVTCIGIFAAETLGQWRATDASVRPRLPDEVGGFVYAFVRLT